MCKTCEQSADNLRIHSAHEYIFYPAPTTHCIKAVCNSQVFRNKSHTFSQSFPTVFLRNLYLLISQLSTPSTGLINTITNR